MQETGSKWRIDALEEFEEDQAERNSLGALADSGASVGVYVPSLWP
jgi:hypothetical protein